MSPTEIRLSTDRRTIEIDWPDGYRQMLGATELRRMSRSAETLSARISGTFQDPGADLSIQAVEPVGVYALNIQFSDGYARGIYPWAFLRAAGDTAEIAAETPEAGQKAIS